MGCGGKEEERRREGDNDLMMYLLYLLSFSLNFFEGGENQSRELVWLVGV